MVYVVPNLKHLFQFSWIVFNYIRNTNNKNADNENNNSEDPD